MEEDVVKETILTKSGVLQQTNKQAKKHSHSLIKDSNHELVFESVELTIVETSYPFSSNDGPKKDKKTQFTIKGVLFCEILVPGSPTL